MCLATAGDPDRQPRYRPAHVTGASHRGFRRLEPVEDQLHFLAQLRGSGSGLLACHGSPRPFSWRRRQRAGKMRAHVLGGGDGRCGRNLPDHCAEVSLGGAHTCAQLPRIDPLTRATGERKRLDQGVEYVFRGRNQLRTRPSRVQAVSSTFGDHLRLDPARIAGVGARDLDKGRPVPLVRSSLALAASTSAAPGQTTVRRRQGAEQQWAQKERTPWSGAEQVSWQRYRRWPP